MDDSQYQRLGMLAATAPRLAGPVTPEMQIWLGQLRALLCQTDDLLNRAAFENAMTLLNAGGIVARARFRSDIMQCLYNALGAASMSAPASLQGAFLPARTPFDAVVAVGKVLSAATKSVLLVDPYADVQILETYAKQASEGIVVEVLSDSATVKPSLKPALVAWSAQFSGRRPAEVRLAPPRALHDRLIVVDRASVWMVGQSFNALATRAPSVITRLDPETASLKIAAHVDMWNSALPI